MLDFIFCHDIQNRRVSKETRLHEILIGHYHLVRVIGVFFDLLNFLFSYLIVVTIILEQVVFQLYRSRQKKAKVTKCLLSNEVFPPPPPHHHHHVPEGLGVFPVP